VISISFIGVGLASELFRRDLLRSPEELFAEVALGSSTIVFHSPHAGHLPIHFELSLPQEEQNHTVLLFAITFSLYLKANLTIFVDK
jgi:hypothetical protein